MVPTEALARPIGRRINSGPKRVQSTRRLIVVYVLLGFIALMFLLPLFWMISTSLKTKPQIFSVPLRWIPNPLTTENYSKLLNSTTFTLWTYLKNSIYYTVLSTFGTLLSCSLGAYAFARLKWWGRDFWFVLTLVVMMIPYPVTMIPLFIFFQKLGWVGSYKPLIIPAFLGNPFFIFMLRQFMLTIPDDLSDAARIDGANELQIWWRIMVPLTRPALVTIALFAILSAWNDYIGPLLYLTDQADYPLALGLANFAGGYRAQYEMMMAAATLVALPMVILFLAAQRQFIEGIALSGMRQ